MYCEKPINPITRFTKFFTKDVIFYLCAFARRSEDAMPSGVIALKIYPVWDIIWVEKHFLPLLSPVGT